MNKLIASYMVIFLLFSYFSSVLEGGGAMVATPATVAITETDTTITTANTTGFLVPTTGFSNPGIMIRNDKVTYTGLTSTQFTGVSGLTDNYPAGTMIYTTDIGVLNKAFGFDIVSTGDEYGSVSAPTVAWNFFTTSLGYLATFNFALLGGDLVYFRYLLLAVAIGFIIYFAIVLLGSLIGAIRG